MSHSSCVGSQREFAIVGQARVTEQSGDRILGRLNALDQVGSIATRRERTEHACDLDGIVARPRVAGVGTGELDERDRVGVGNPAAFEDVLPLAADRGVESTQRVVNPRTWFRVPSIAQLPRRDPRHHAEGLDVVGHDRTRRDHAVSANGDAVDDHDVGTEPHVVLDDETFRCQALLHDRHGGVVEDVVLTDEHDVRGDAHLTSDRDLADGDDTRVQAGEFTDGHVAADLAATRDRAARTERERRRVHVRVEGHETLGVHVVPFAGGQRGVSGDPFGRRVGHVLQPPRLVLEPVGRECIPPITRHLWTPAPAS